MVDLDHSLGRQCLQVESSRSSAALEILRTAGRDPSIRKVWSRSLATDTAVPSTPKSSNPSASASRSVNDGGGRQNRVDGSLVHAVSSSFANTRRSPGR